MLGCNVGPGPLRDTRLVRHHQQIARRFPELRLTTANVKMLHSERIFLFKIVRCLALRTPSQLTHLHGSEVD
jgi:hypothetical protein